MLKDLLSEGRKRILAPPYPSLPAALKDLVSARGLNLSTADVEVFLETFAEGPRGEVRTGNRELVYEESAGHSDAGYARNNEMPFAVPDMSHTTVLSSSFLRKSHRNWLDLVREAIRESVRRQIPFAEVQRSINGQLRSSMVNGRGFSQIPGTDLWLQGMEANRAVLSLVQMACLLREPLSVTFLWRAKGAHPGETWVLSRSSCRPKVNR